MQKRISNKSSGQQINNGIQNKKSSKQAQKLQMSQVVNCHVSISPNKRYTHLQLQNLLLSIPIVEKMSMLRGDSHMHRLIQICKNKIKRAAPEEYLPELQRQRECGKNIWLMLIIQGSVQVQLHSKKRQSNIANGMSNNSMLGTPLSTINMQQSQQQNLRTTIISSSSSPQNPNLTNIRSLCSPCYHLIQQSTFRISFSEYTQYFLLEQKQFLPVFQSIFPMPFLTARLKQLRKTEIFNNIEKKRINKIVSELQEIQTNIGSKLQTQIEVIQKVNQREKERQEHSLHQKQQYRRTKKRFYYYIISGEIKIFRQGIAICVLGPKQLFGAQTVENQQIKQQYLIQLIQKNLEKCSIGVVITQTAHLYKIPAQLLTQSTKAVEYVDKRVKWRETRLNKIIKLVKQQKSKKIQEAKVKASFVDKQIIMKSFYGNKVSQLLRMKQVCNKQQLKCQSRQEYYSRKLDEIKRMQRKRYGSLNKTTVLFPIPVGKTIKNLAKAMGVSSIFLQQQPQMQNEKIKTATATPKTSKRVHTQPIINNNYHFQSISSYIQSGERISTKSKRNPTFFATNF